ncbi:MAG: hypothetical protein K2I76_04275, partial [Malacoplasma sp.]|nr:hypothetical protein [Malacoplasma sp.]
FSLFSFPLVALPIGLATLNSSSNSVHLISKSLNVNESTSDSSINLEDALPVADSSISSFGDYIVSYEDNNISPVNVIIPPLDANQGTSKSGGATVGMTANKQTITVTTYAGLLLWSHKLTENTLLKNYYKTVLSVEDISTYKVINFAFLESKNILFVLFGNESTVNNVTTLNNLVVFGLDINSGAIVVPKDAKLAESQIIGKARNNSEFIFFNSSDQLIVTSGNTITDINNSTKIMSFDSDSTGFANVENKGNDEETNNFSYSAIATNISGSMLIGFLPSQEKNINYSLWLANATRGLSAVTFSYDTSNATTASPPTTIAIAGTNTNQRRSFDYYIVPVKDDFTNIGTDFGTVNKNGSDIASNTADRGYLNINQNKPVFESVYKRFFYTGSSADTANKTLTENFGVLLDSYYSMMSSFASFPVLVNTETDTVSLKTLSSKVYNMNSISSSNNGPSTEDLKNLPNDVSINYWEYNSVGYDKESNFVYFSLSGQETDVSGDSLTELNKYYTNIRYINLKDDNASKNISVDAYVESDPYTLSDVNFDTYTDQNNLYLTKQVIDGNDGQWMTTSVADFDDDQKDFEPTTNINFSSLETLAKDVENSQVLDEIMPSAVGKNLSNLDKFLTDKNWKDAVKFLGASGNDETGEINLETEITYANNFGDGVKDNGTVSYVSYIYVTGFSLKDFSLTFKQDTDSAVIDIKTKYSAEEIVKNNSKPFVINHLFENLVVKGKKFIPPEESVTLKNGTSTNSLVIEIKVPIKTSPTDEKGILPVGFPEKDAVLTFTYNGFTGTETPPIEEYPGSTNKPENPNSTDGLSPGEIAGIVIGCLALAAIIIATIVLIRIRTKAKVNA